MVLYLESQVQLSIRQMQDCKRCPNFWAHLTRSQGDAGTTCRLSPKRRGAKRESTTRLFPFAFNRNCDEILGIQLRTAKPAIRQSGE